jgi:hypothetical protein
MVQQGSEYVERLGAQQLELRIEDRQLGRPVIRNDGGLGSRRVA